jgi:hypothetical protein
MKPKLSLLLATMLIFFAFTASHCKKSIDQLSLLPPITNTGANTFGCLVQGKAILPKSPASSFSNPFPNPALDIIFMPEIRLQMGSNEAFACLYFYNLYSTGSGNYKWAQTQYGGEAFPLYNNQLYGVFMNPKTNQNEWYGSYYNSGSTTITNFDTAGHIISGTFSGKLKQRFGTDSISITDGRFDINWTTARYKIF